MSSKFAFLSSIALVAAVPAPQLSLPFSLPSLSLPTGLPTGLGSGLGSGLPSGLGSGLGSGIPSATISGLGAGSTTAAAALPTSSSSGTSSLGGLTGLASSGSSTSNDINDGNCRPVALIFARGTTETGNMGSVVGPGLASALQDALGADQVSIQGIDYPADTSGAITGATNPSGSEGAQTCASLVQKALSCGSTKIAVSGYSQGAEVAHGCLQNLQAGQVGAVVTYGDPLKSQQFQNIDASKTKVFCADGDGVCSGTFAISAAHLSYGSDGDTTTGAQFIASAFGSS